MTSNYPIINEYIWNQHFTNQHIRPIINEYIWNQYFTNQHIRPITNEYIWNQHFTNQHFILECSKYVEIRRKYIKPYYCINPSAFKLTQLLSVQNIKELNNLGKYLYVAEKIRNS